MQLAVIAAGAAAGWRLLEAEPVGGGAPPAGSSGRRAGATLLGAFALLIVGLPVAASLSDVPGLAVFDSFFRAGALVFGGGHVVLPLLEAEVVEPGWVGRDTFLAGYGAAQALPGPLFTIAAFLGAHIPFFDGPATARWSPSSRSSPLRSSSCRDCSRTGTGFADGAPPGTPSPG